MTAVQGGTAITDPREQVAVLLQALSRHEGLPVVVVAFHHLGTLPDRHLLPEPLEDL